MKNYSRREFLKVVGGGVTTAAAGSFFLPRLFTSVAQAQSAPQIKYVLHVYLSGGVDGMFLVGPYGDDFKSVRRDLYPDPGSPNATLLTNAAGRDLYMHQSMNTFFRSAWNRNELLVIAGAGVGLRPSGSHEVATRLIAAGANDGN